MPGSIGGWGPRACQRPAPTHPQTNRLLPYRLQLTASNVHSDHGEPTEAAPVVLGLPDAPTVTEVTPTVGKVALKWTAAQTNAFIGTK